MRCRFGWVILFFLIVFVTLPAYSYVDPSGGLLFQVLMPTLAAIWGAWMIFASRIRRGMSNMIRKLRGIEEPE